MKRLLLEKLASIEHVPIFKNVEADRQHRLTVEAEVAYQLLVALVVSINYDHPELSRLRRLINRAHKRSMRRSINSPCGGCGKPATIVVRGESKMSKWCEACYDKEFPSGGQE